MKPIIALGSDHAGFRYKEAIKDFLIEKDFEVIDFGAFSTESVDYPDYVHPLAEAIGRKEAGLGILVCGSGNGVCMTANKHAHIRAALVWNEELAELARQHNNANVLCIAERFISLDQALSAVRSFLNSEFEGGRHEKRVEKIRC